MKMSEAIKRAVRSFLEIEPPENQAFSVQEELDFFANAFVNSLWYRGSAVELNQFYRQLNSETCPFWGAISSKGLEIRKIHTGIPKEIIDTLTNIVIRDMNDIKLKDDSKAQVWKKIEKENKLKKLISKATKKVLIVGDGACKISFDSNVSKYPILEWVAGDKIEFKYERDRLKEIIFTTEYKKRSKKYFLFERYGYGYINYELYCDENRVPLSSLDKTADLQNIIFDKSFMLAVPYKVIESEKYDGRGQSLFEGKRDNFDALDETWSQFMHALRASRTIKYIPETLIPRDSRNGELLKPNPFDNQFIKTATNMAENATNQIDVKQPDFPAEKYLEAYFTALDLCLQGLISPSTLGIDVKKRDNADAQREKEKTTLHTRGIIIEGLSEFLETLVNCVFKAYNTALKLPLEDTDADIAFGEYANPSFEAVVETMSNPNTPMSIEAKVDEIWGDDKNEEWKAKEVERIKAQQGVVVLEEPALNQGEN